MTESYDYAHLPPGADKAILDIYHEYHDVLPGLADFGGEIGKLARLCMITGGD